jgi:beta-glucanase (GH16 family)
MVKNKPSRTTRLILSLIVVVAVGVAGAVAISTSSNAPAPVVHRHAPPVVSASTTAATSTAPAATTTSVLATATTPTTSASAKQPPTPLGVGGAWKLVFSESFSGHSLDRSIWNAHNGWTNQNAATDSLSNVKLRNGQAILTLASDSSGAELGTRHFALKVGEFAEARIKFAGNGHTIYNWPAFWLSGPDWPRGGENDIAEGFGALTINYHAPTVVRHSGPIGGDWANRFHIFGIYRGRWQSHVYWDGKLIGNYDTDDDGEPESLLLTLGSGNQIRTGATGAMAIDFVRAWEPAKSPHG